MDLTDGTSTLQYSDETENFLARMILTGGSDALINYFGTDGPHWQRLDIASGTLQAELEGVPDAPSFDGTDLLGVQVTGKVGAVVRYKLSTQKATVVSDTSWGGQYSVAASTALVQ